MTIEKNSITAATQGMEVEERPGGEEREMVENRVVEEAGHRPLRIDLRMNPLEEIQRVLFYGCQSPELMV